MRISDWSSDVCSSDLRGYQPEWTVLIQVPLPLVSELRNVDVPRIGILLAYPIPAIARDHTCAIAFLVQLLDELVEPHGRIDDPEVAVCRVEVWIVGFTASQPITHPYQVPNRPTSADMSREPETGHCCRRARDNTHQG